MKKNLQKFIAESGYCSRRKAEELILQGKVKVNKSKALIGAKVSDKDEVIIKGRTIKPQKNIYVLVNKPKGYVCTNKKELDQKNIFSLVNIKERLFIVGRLDKNSRGLVLLTNDGDLTQKLTHPSFNCEKEYLVEIDREISREMQDRMKKGIDIKEKTLAKVKLIKKIGRNRYRIILTEGKNHQIKRMFEKLNRSVRDLQRVRIDKYKLSSIKQGSWVLIEKKDE